MSKRESVHPIFDSSFEDRDDTLSPSNEEEPKKRKKIMKKSSNNKHLNFFSQPESLFLQFDPKICNNSQGLNLECSPDTDFDVCTQPVQKNELRTGKKSWRPPTNQCFSSNKYEIMDTNFSSLSQANHSIDNTSSDITNNIKDETGNTDLSVLIDKNSVLYLSQEQNTINEEKNPIDTKSKNDEEQHLSSKSDNDNDNRVSDINSDNEEESQEENNDILEVNEIDELIDKKIEDHFSTECEIELKKLQPNVTVKNQIFSNRINGISSDDSEDEFNLTVNNANQLHKLGEYKILQEDEDRLLENSQSPQIDHNIFKSDPSENNKSLKNVLAENLLTTIIEDKEENEFDLTITNSQLLQIEKEYSKSSIQAKHSERSTQTLPISELQSSMENYPLMIGGVKKMKNDIQKIRQCVQELKRINAVLVKARKEVWMQRNISHGWNSPSMKNHPPPHL